MYIGVDLGSTNIKAAIYDKNFNLVDRQSPDALSHPVAHTDDAAYILECLAENPRFLRTPIVRNGEQVTLGADEKTWEEWLKKG